MSHINLNLFYHYFFTIHNVYAPSKTFSRLSVAAHLLAIHIIYIIRYGSIAIVVYIHYLRNRAVIVAQFDGDDIAFGIMLGYFLEPSTESLQGVFLVCRTFNELASLYDIVSRSDKIACSVVALLQRESAVKIECTVIIDIM